MVVDEKLHGLEPDRLPDSSNSNSVTAIILAAGAGHRIGMPKWQLEFNGESFIDIIRKKLVAAGLQKICCVVRKESIPPLDMNYVINPVPELGMISSIFRAVKESPISDHYLIIPVDCPFVKISTIKHLCLSGCKNTHRRVIRPEYQNKTGHPIVVPFEIASTIPENYDGGLRVFFSDHDVDYYDITVDDCNILDNINTVEDLISSIR